MSEHTREEIAGEMTYVIVKYLETLPAEERRKRLKAFLRSLKRPLREKTVPQKKSKLAVRRGEAKGGV